MNPKLPQGVRLDMAQGSLPRLSIDTHLCTAELFLYGGHLTAWQPKTQDNPVLWMSKKSWFETGKPLRGGVPVCFPWFGPLASNLQAPGHGVARLHLWTLEHVTRENDGTIVIDLFLASTPSMKALVADEFQLRYSLRLGQTLSLSMTVQNPNPLPFSCELALHTYFTVGDIRQVHITGLSDALYIDKTDQLQRKTQGPEPITIAAETDRLYLNTTATTWLTDASLRRKITVAKSGSNSTVVWNPWIAKSKAMPDFGDDEFNQMICIETVNAADNRLNLSPGSGHTMTASVQVDSI